MRAFDIINTEIRRVRQIERASERRNTESLKRTCEEIRRLLGVQKAVEKSA